MSVTLSTESAPTVKTLLEESHAVTDGWQEVGLFLGLEYSDIRTIELDCQQKLRRCMMVMFNKWLKQETNPTWEKYCEALEKASYVVLAKELREKYCSSVPIIPPSTCETADSCDQISPKDSDVVIEINAKGDLAERFEEIQISFTRLVQDTEATVLDEDITLGRLKRCCKEHFEQFPMDEVNSVEQLFTEISKYYCFLNYAFLGRIIKTFLKHTDLIVCLKEYDQQLEKFLCSTTLEDFKEMILNAYKPSDKLMETTAGFHTVFIKLEGLWLDKSLKDMRKLVKFIFKDKAAILTNLKVFKGSVVTVFLVPQSEVNSLVALARDELYFMFCVGVCELRVGEEVIKIVQRNDLFSFENALIESVTNITSGNQDAEEKAKELQVMNFLLEVKTSPNAMDKQNWTGLMMGSNAGNTEVVSQLLKAGAKPDIQGGPICSTALILASWKGNSGVISLLLEANASLNLKNNYGTSALWMASTGGHSRAVELLLKAKANPDLADNTGATALYVASKNNHFEVVSLLLAAGADPNTQLGDGKSALFAASSKGNSDIVTLLLANNAKPDLVTNQGDTAFHCASSNGHLEVVQQLLQANANPNLRNKWGDTALFAASVHGHSEIVDMILSHDSSSLNVQTSEERSTSICAASENGYEKVVNLLLKANANLELQRKDGTTALWMASQCGHQEVVSLLLTAHANPNHKSDKGATPLHIASAQGHLKIAQLLLDKEMITNLNIQMNEGQTALYLASEEGHSDVVSLLLKGNANPNIPNNDGRTPLYQASQYGHEKVVKLLLKANAKVNEACYDGTTALYMASQNGHTRIVSLLLSADANPNTQHDSGATALHLASQTGNTDIVRMLLLKANDNSICNIQTASGVTALHLAVQNQHHAVVSLLLLHKANPNLQATTGVTPLLISSENGNEELASMLLHNNADPNLRFKDGETALFPASHKGHLQIVKLLLKYNADPNLCHDDGTTPLYVASQQGHAEIVRLLLKYNANPNTTTVDGWHTPLMVASCCGYQTITELLLSHGADPNMKDSAGKTALALAKSFSHETLAHRLLQVTEIVIEATNDQPTSPPLSRTVTTLQESQAEELTHKQSLKKSMKEFLGITKNEPKKPVIKKLQTVAVDVIVFIHGK